MSIRCTTSACVEGEGRGLVGLGNIHVHVYGPSDRASPVGVILVRDAAVGVDVAARAPVQHVAALGAERKARERRLGVVVPLGSGAMGAPGAAPDLAQLGNDHALFGTRVLQLAHRLLLLQLGVVQLLGQRAGLLLALCQRRAGLGAAGSGIRRVSERASF